MAPLSPHPFVTRDLALRLELASAWRAVHYAGAYQKLHPQAACASLEISGGMASFISPSSPVNKAAGLGLTGPVTPGDLSSLEDFFLSRGGRPTIDVCPLADPSLFEAVRARGYRLDGFFNVLVRVLPEGFQASPLPPGLRITRAQIEEAERWLQVVGRGFEETSTLSPETVDILSPNFYADQSATYFAWIDEQPAAGGGMYMHAGVVELGGASTLPAYRRRGAHTALIEARLAGARELGCDWAMVLTRPGINSQRSVEQAGFWLAYTKAVMAR